MPNDLNESAVLNTEPDNSEWEQQQRANLDAEYEQGVREADAERRYEESLIAASEPGAAEEMAAFRAREEAISGIEAQPSDPNSLSPLATEDIWGEPISPELADAIQHDVELIRAGRNQPEDPLSPEIQSAVDHDAALLQEHFKDSSAAQQKENLRRTEESVDKTSQDGTPLRIVTSTRTAEYQPATNTVDFTNKLTSSKSELVPGEGLSGSPEMAEVVRSRTDEVLGAKIDRDEFDNSDQPLEIADRAADTRERGLESAKALASHELKTNAQVTLADKNDGIYNGKILGVTDSYLLQRSGPSSAIAHDKGMFESLPSYGRDAAILYSAGNARVSLQPTKDKGLGIER